MVDRGRARVCRHGRRPRRAGRHWSHSGAITARRLEDGDPLWSQPAVDADPSKQHFTGGLAIQASLDGSADVVFVAETVRQLPFNPTATGSLSAYAASDGHLLWRSQIGSFGQVTVDNGRVFARVRRNVGDSSDFSAIVAFDAASGTELFRIATTSSVFAIAGETLFVPTETDLIAYPTHSCGTSCPSRWTAPLLSTQGSIPGIVAAGGRVFVGMTGGLEVFAAAGCGTTVCAALWRAAGPADQLAVAEGRVYATANWVRSDRAPMLVFDAAGCGAAQCAPIWSTAADLLGPPSVANGIVYVAQHGTSFRAWSADGCGAAQCDPIWTMSGSYPGNPTVLIADSRVLVASVDLDVFGLAHG